MRLISICFNNHKILGPNKEIFFFKNSRNYKGKKPIYLKYEKLNKNKNNYYTFIIGACSILF